MSVQGESTNQIAQAAKERVWIAHKIILHKNWRQPDTGQHMSMKNVPYVHSLI